ncbi:hypothetical protein ASPZODRAFT_128579 [Penicilliopsis zonata CBS 506.65]|uniref:Uncharacterized protein n=1 Tax=Penicilliopsis zonata CBS 506.65 TaxID=1073090 RepID=A0A1L9SS14_9EURO|nr:hypothetical protein ASPZODRAFT_128579 [Penicilliopsis zonata CBS 506.65]OJJ49990.1 hypothetical protein ASPZODRAFT_128579 [Penicilliopsis zonata CBS 506.65]
MSYCCVSTHCPPTVLHCPPLSTHCPPTVHPLSMSSPASPQSRQPGPPDLPKLPIHETPPPDGVRPSHAFILQHAAINKMYQ